MTLLVVMRIILLYCKLLWVGYFVSILEKHSGLTLGLFQYGAVLYLMSTPLSWIDSVFPTFSSLKSAFRVFAAWFFHVAFHI